MTDTSNCCAVTCVTITCGAAIPATGACILTKAGYTGYSACKLAEAGIKGLCCLPLFTDMSNANESTISFSSASPLLTSIGSACTSGVTLEQAAAASVVGGAACHIAATIAPCLCFTAMSACQTGLRNSHSQSYQPIGEVEDPNDEQSQSSVTSQEPMDR